MGDDACRVPAFTDRGEAAAAYARIVEVLGEPRWALQGFEWEEGRFPLFLAADVGFVAQAMLRFSGTPFEDGTAPVGDGRGFEGFATGFKGDADVAEDDRVAREEWGDLGGERLRRDLAEHAARLAAPDA